jgi:hypothetical protein
MWFISAMEHNSSKSELNYVVCRETGWTGDYHIEENKPSIQSHGFTHTQTLNLK